MNCIVCNKKLSGKQKKFCSIKCKNDFHLSYDKQQQKGLERRTRLIKDLGGKCSLCGYNKNLAALSFHHLNPNDKEIDLTLRECSNNSFKKLKAESLKCILLCSNCHMELHYPQYSIT